MIQVQEAGSSKKKTYYILFLENGSEKIIEQSHSAVERELIT